MYFFLKSKLAFLILLCAFAWPPVLSAAPDRHITSNQWQKLTSDDAFTYAHDTEKVVQQKPYQPSGFDNFVSGFFKLLNGETGHVLAWILVIGIVGYILYKLFAGNDSILFGRKKVAVGEVAEDTAEDVATTNWDTLIHQAASNNDYRLAVRYSYMRLLQLLQQHELISYRTDKTNSEYYTELAQTNYKQPFKQLSRQYEYAWYGHFEMNAQAYNDYMSLFNNFKTQLGA